MTTATETQERTTSPGLLARIVPDCVATAETRDDLMETELFDEELRSLGRAVDKRRREFVSGRACAREAVAQLGQPPVAIPSGERGEPIWPDGITGSISHCKGYRASAVARTGLLNAVGIDVEVNAPLPEGVFDQIAFRRERLLRGEAQGVWLDRLLFSAKEAVYKAWFPCARRWLGFEDVEMSIDLRASTFRTQLLVTGPVVDGVRLTELRGRFCADDELICTAVTVPRLGVAAA